MVQTVSDHAVCLQKMTSNSSLLKPNKCLIVYAKPFAASRVNVIVGNFHDVGFRESLCFTSICEKRTLVVKTFLNG